MVGPGFCRGDGFFGVLGTLMAHKATLPTAMRERLSPNFNERPVVGRIDMLVLHYTGMRTGEAALERLCDPVAKVSSHYLVEEDGTTWRLVPEEKRAWHAGVSFWAGERDINDFSIGIELVNPGHEFGYRLFSEAQMQALEALARDIVDRHAIQPHRVVGHSDVAPTRKTDPGELFDWARLARKGIGLWPGDAQRGAIVETDIRAAQADLARYGYELAPTGVLDEATRSVIVAFQRHFRPRSLDGRLDPETQALIAAVARQVG